MKDSAALLMLLPLLLASCSNAVMDPKYERNPNPQKHYVVTIKIDGAPGPFHAVKASAFHQIKHTGCMPDAEPFSGHFPTPDRHGVETEMRRISDTEYQFDLFLDDMAEKDYFGKGPCFWELQMVSVRLRPTGAPRERIYMVTADGDELIEKSPIEFYARREMYANPFKQDHELEEDAVEKRYAATRYGTDDPTRFFTITLHAKEQGNGS